MNRKTVIFDAADLGFIAIYLLLLLVIGLIGWRSKKNNTLQDFYLGGRGTGIWVLLLTLYATQYSGNTLFGFTGKTYRVGFAWTVSIQFMITVIVVYLSFAPKLFAISRRYNFVTPADYLQHRFNHPKLSLIASIVMILAIGNFLLAQLMAMGKAVDGLFGADSTLAYGGGVIFLAGLIVVYESLGGFRAVAWTDAIQGSILFLGFASLLFLVFQQFGSLESATNLIAQQSPKHLDPPDAQGIREWVSYLVIVGVGCALYPQAIQRIYCARNAKTLRISLMWMAFLPLVTTLVSLIAGVMGRAYLPGLSSEQSDSMLTLLCGAIQDQSPIAHALVVILFAAILAAMMSTADSILLSISSMITKDLFSRWLWRDAPEAVLMKVGKRCSWFLVALLSVGAILLKETTLVSLLDRKLDLLVQLSPAFILSLWWSRLRSREVLCGLVAGIALSLGMTIAGHGKLYGIHAGLYGLAINLTIAVSGSWLRQPLTENPAEPQQSNEETIVKVGET